MTGAMDFLELLRQADDWKIVQTEALQLSTGRRKLAFAAIDDDEVRDAGCGMRDTSGRFSR